MTKHYKCRAIHSFVFQGQFIAEGEVVDCDKEAYTQLVKEEHLCELIKSNETKRQE